MTKPDFKSKRSSVRKGAIPQKRPAKAPQAEIRKTGKIRKLPSLPTLGGDNDVPNNEEGQQASSSEECLDSVEECPDKFQKNYLGSPESEGEEWGEESYQETWEGKPQENEVEDNPGTVTEVTLPSKREPGHTPAIPGQPKDPIFKNWQERNPDEICRGVEALLVSDPSSNMVKLKGLVELAKLTLETDMFRCCVFLSAATDICVSANAIIGTASVDGKQKFDIGAERARRKLDAIRRDLIGTLVSTNVSNTVPDSVVKVSLGCSLRFLNFVVEAAMAEQLSASIIHASNSASDIIALEAARTIAQLLGKKITGETHAWAVLRLAQAFESFVKLRDLAKIRPEVFLGFMVPPTANGVKELNPLEASATNLHNALHKSGKSRKMKAIMKEQNKHGPQGGILRQSQRRKSLRQVVDEHLCKSTDSAAVSQRIALVHGVSLSHIVLGFVRVLRKFQGTYCPNPEVLVMALEALSSPALLRLMIQPFLADLLGISMSMLKGKVATAEGKERSKLKAKHEAIDSIHTVVPPYGGYVGIALGVNIPSSEQSAYDAFKTLSDDTDAGDYRVLVGDGSFLTPKSVATTIGTAAVLCSCRVLKTMNDMSPISISFTEAILRKGQPRSKMLYEIKRDITLLHTYTMHALPRMISDHANLEKCCLGLVACELVVLTPELAVKRISALVGRIVACCPLATVFATRHMLKTATDIMKMAPKAARWLDEGDLDCLRYLLAQSVDRKTIQQSLSLESEIKRSGK